MAQQKIEQILDQAISRLKNGENFSLVLSDCPAELRGQLAANLDLAQLALNLPKRQAPAPLKRKLYLQAAPQSRLSRMADFIGIYAAALTVLVLAIGSVAYATAQSLPGDKLFGLKLDYEQLELKLASNPEQRARLQLTFANSRLAEVEKTLADKNYSQTGAAIDELNTQTQVALNNIKQIAAANPSAGKDPSLLNSVKSLANDQTQLIDKVAQTKPSAQIAASTQQTEQNIEQLVATADDQTTVSLPANATIDITGTISSITANSIQIDKNIYLVDSNTVAQNKDGAKIELNLIAVGDTVRIEGQTKDQDNIAQKITLITAAPKTSQPGTELKPAPANSGSTQMDNTPVPAKPNDISGGFIPEAPADPNGH